METLAANGLTIEVPRGWEAELSALGRASDLDTAVPLVARPRVVLHAANFALPPDRGDYGSGATEVMDSGGVLVVLLEFDQASAGTALFALDALPATLSADDFDPRQVERPQRNQTGLQRFFHVGDRAFCLYVVLGSHTMRAMLVAEANRILAGIRID